MPSVVIEPAESFTQLPLIAPTRPIHLKLSIDLFTEFTPGLIFVTGMLSARVYFATYLYNVVVVGKAVRVFTEIVPSAWSYHFVQWENSDIKQPFSEHSFTEHLLDAYCVLGTVVVIGNTLASSKRGHRFHFFES